MTVIEQIKHEAELLSGALAYCSSTANSEHTDHLMY
jgi:hypothetical protein